MRIASLVIVGVLSVAATARAEDRAGEIHGFVWHGQDHVEGQVSDPAGHPIAGAMVHVVSTGDVEHVIATDRAGQYRVKVAPGAQCLVFVYGDLTISSSAVSSHVVRDEETIEMHDAPAVAPPRPRHRPRLPPYSEAATDHDEWLRAWLLLDVDESGVVKRVKLLDHPGYELDAIAVRAAFDLDLEPARDRANRPTHSHLLWAFDWPAYSWMVANAGGLMTKIPDSVKYLSCQGSGDRRTDEKSCAPPTLANALSAPWIARPARR
jgi:hypothetical protein